MSHILILKSSQQDELITLLMAEVINVLNTYGHTYDEITVPTIKEMPIAMNLLAESMTYEATICVGLYIDNKMELSNIQYQEIVRSIYDYSTYFGHIVGIGVIYTKKLQLQISDCVQYVGDVTHSVCEMIKTIRDINSMEGSGYGRGSLKHN